MRRNIFLHFLNRDTREIFRIEEILDRANHARVLREALNVSAMLCEDACYAPPGFVIEDELAFQLFESQSAFLKTGLVQLPIRERSLADYAEKKRGEYAPARNRYSGLFDNSRMDALSAYGAAIGRRQAKIGPAIVNGFESGVDGRGLAWKQIRETASAKVVDNLRKVPGRLADEGKALTWSIMEPNFLPESKPLHKEMRDALQHVYFKEYCREYDLILISDIQYMNEIFYLPSDRSVYSFRRFHMFLGSFQSADLFLQASADFIVQMRSTNGFVDLMDAYVGMAKKYASDADLQYHTRNASEAASFDWKKLGARRLGTIADPTAFEAIEIADACSELAAILAKDHDLVLRSELGTKENEKTVKTPLKGSRMEVAIFVALEEELEVLLKQLKLERNASRPAATGEVGGVRVSVLCPRAMGRVAAAVETTRFLAEAQQKPDLILCVGLAGGFKEAGIDPGTVICVDTVVDLASRKVRDDDLGNANSKFRRQDFDCTRAIYSVATSRDFDLCAWEGKCREEFEWPKGRVPSIREGKIASADEVVASDEHRKKMVDSADKLLGVEMEAGGVCAAAKSFKIPVGVVRVVSDMADPSKGDDHWRRLGMKALAELIATIPFESVRKLL